MDMPTNQAIKRPTNGQPISPLTPVDATVNLSFNVPFASSLTGPEVDEILHASPKALERWTFPDGTEENTPIHKLPVHQSNVEQLRRQCRVLSEGSQGRMEATVVSTEPKAVPNLQRQQMKGLVTNVCVSGDAETVYKMRAKILNETPIALVRPTSACLHIRSIGANIEPEMCCSRHRHQPCHHAGHARSTRRGLEAS